MNGETEGFVIRRVGNRDIRTHALLVRKDGTEKVLYFTNSSNGRKANENIARTFRPQPWNMTIEQINAFNEFQAELDRIMPQVTYFGSSIVYQCKQCGGAVFDRVAHLNFHKGEKFYETILTLFG